MNILGLIPARGGSKGIPAKNIAPLAGRPLISYTIETALRSEKLARVVVSTDDEAIREVALASGAEVPFTRPAEVSGDDASALSVMRHAVQALEQEQNWSTDLLVYLQPTSPFRTHRHIDGAIELMLRGDADTIVSTVAVPHRFSPDSLMETEADGFLRPCSTESNPRRQDKKTLYARNGPAVLVLRRDRIDHDRLYAGRTVGMEMDWRSSIDIDDSEDLAVAECLMTSAGRNSEG